MSGIPVPAVAPARPVERVLWRLRKGQRLAEARVRDLPHGYELRFIADHVLRWRQVFRGDRRELTARANDKRHDFERLGWTAMD